jgi:hypothetical protein
MTTTRQSHYWIDYLGKEYSVERCIKCAALCGNNDDDCVHCVLRGESEFRWARNLEKVCHKLAQQAFENSTTQLQTTLGEDHPATIKARAIYGNFLARWCAKKFTTFEENQIPGPEILLQAFTILTDCLSRQKKYYGDSKWMFEETLKDLAWVEVKLKK